MTEAAGRKPGRGYGNTTSRASTPPPAPLPAELRTKPVRVTVDLPAVVHRKLKRWCNGSAAELDLSRVDLSVVFRILADELLEEDRLAEKVRRRLQDGDGQL